MKIFQKEIFQKENNRFLLYSLFLALVFLAVCSKSSFLYPFNDWYDANDFLTMGKGIVHGLVPYRDLYEQKGPILYFLHSICYLIPGPHFFGVYLLETGAFALFLYYASRIIRLYLRPAASYIILPVLAGLVLSSESFCQGDSAEELCAALLMITLYHTLEYFQKRSPEPMAFHLLFLNGLLAGIILWIKYTLLGMHLAFMAVLFFLCVGQKRYLRSVKSCLVFLAGMAVPGIPVLLYFAVHGALGDLFEVYFYNNIFLYDSGKASGIGGLVLTILLRIGDTFFRNLQFSVFTVIGVLAFLISRRFLPSAAGKLMLLLEAGFLAAFIYTGSNFPYYGYILCIFPVLGFTAVGAGLSSLIGALYRIPSFKELLAPVVRILPPQLLWQLRAFGYDPDSFVRSGYRQQRGRQPFGQESGSVPWFGALLFTLIFLVFAYYKSPNTYMLGMPRNDLVQYRFAEIIQETPDATLLNYGFLDAGFYTVCDILPSEKYFQMQNISYETFPEMMDSQDACIREQRVDYVIVRGETVPEQVLEYYTVVTERRQLYEGANVNYILLKKAE